MNTHRLRRAALAVARVVVVAAAYFIAARLGLWLHALNGFASLIWAPTGIALASVLLFGTRIWPGIAAGAFLANLAQGAAPTMALGIATGNTLEALAGAWALRRVPGFRVALDRLVDVVALIVGAAVGSTMISATVGVASLLLAGRITPDRFATTWAVWWLGDATGDLLIAPLILVWWTRGRALRRREVVELLVVLGTLMGTSLIVFTGWGGAGAGAATKPYLLYPLLVWSALRFGPRGGVIAGSLTSSIATFMTLRNMGPFTGPRLGDSLFALQSFMDVTVVTVLILGAIQSEREAALQLLNESQDDLEARIRQRTAQYALVNQELQREVDERRRAECSLEERESELRSSEERFRAVAETAHDAIVTTDAEGRVVYFNGAAERMFGLVEKDVIGRPVRALIPEGLYEQYRKMCAALAPSHLSHAAIELQARRSNGATFPVDVSIAAWNTDEGRAFFTGILRDLTDRRNEEQRLRHSEERLRLIVDGVKDLAIISLDPEGRIVSWNAGAERIKGFPASEILGQHYSRFFTPEDVQAGKPAAILTTVAATGRVEDEGWRVRRDGSHFWAQVIMTVLHDAEGRLCGFAKVTRDLTERKVAEEGRQRAYEGLEARVRERTVELSRANAELKQEIVERRRVERRLERQARVLAQSNAELELFAHVASHDLQEPLRTVTSYTQLLERRYRGKLGPDADTFIGYAVEATSWMHALLDDLLAYSKLGRAESRMERLNGEPLLLRALMNLDHRIRKSGAVVTHDPLPDVVGDAHQLVQLLQNLISNAIKFHSERPPRIHVSARRIGMFWRFSVRDNGIGMEPRHLERIFMMFERLHTRGEYPGTGVGLAICKKIVERHGGHIWARSSPGTGSDFMFTLQRANASVRRGGEETASAFGRAPQPAADERARKPAARRPGKRTVSAP